MDNELNDAATAPQQGAQDDATTDYADATTAHSDYHPGGVKDDEGKLQLTGMYQNWFLDYASYVILERAVPHLGDGLKPVQRRILHSMKLLDDGRYNKVAPLLWLLDKCWLFCKMGVSFCYGLHKNSSMLPFVFLS